MHYFSCILIACFQIVRCHATEVVFEMEIDRPLPDSITFTEYSVGTKQPAKFAYASYFQDHMVLQGEPRKAVIWGYAPSGLTDSSVNIILTPGDHNFVAVVEENLTWRAEIGPFSPGGPYTVKASLYGMNIQLTDVMFGDIWVCSGQSNMQFPLTQVFNSTAELADTAHYPDIRLFVINYNISSTPLTDFESKGILLPWSRSAPDKVQQGNFSAVCWLYGKYIFQTLNKPIGLIETSVGGTPVEAWSSTDALNKCGLQGIHMHKAAEKVPWDMWGPADYSSLWNAMVHPLVNMTIFGAIWYQGESNAGSSPSENRDLYNCTFPSMIDDWRKKFSTSSGTSQLFPFGFVQLGGFRPDNTVNVGFPDIRWHQTADYGYVPNHRQRNVFMAVAMDLPDFTSPYGSVHPRDKQDVAVRLALSGLAVAYQQNVSYQGPYPVKVSLSTAEEPFNYTLVEIEYTEALEQRWLDGFEICCAFMDPATCEPGKSWWLPTTTTQSTDSANVTQSYASECVMKDVVGIRYAWRESPCPFKNCAVYGADNGLPMPPFTYAGEAGFRKRLIAAGKYEVSIGHSKDTKEEENSENLLNHIHTSHHINTVDVKFDHGNQEITLIGNHVEKNFQDSFSKQKMTASRNFSFASYYGDHMVLQGSPRKAVIWGYAPENSTTGAVIITVYPGNATYMAVVTENQLWAATIGPINAGGPYNITASLGKTVLTLFDVLFGDVWVCSGQSNMQFSMSQIFNSSEELQDTINYPDIRVFVVKDKTSDVPLTDLASDGVLLPWSKPTPETIGGGNFTFFSAVCWLYGKYLYQQLKKPLGLLETSWGGTPVEAWSSPDALKKCGLTGDRAAKSRTLRSRDGVEGPQSYKVLWNAMVHPLLNMTIYGAIWYQGENNVQLNENLYNCTFPAMIDDWRKKFSSSGETHQLFPFGFVQLAGFEPDYSIATGFPDIRWHQTADYGYVPNHRQRNVFMAVAMDLPDFTSPYGSIHPRDKQDVAWRLALGGLAIGYKLNVSFQGPYPVKVIISQAEEPYNFTQVEVEYTMSLEQRWLDGFEICCSFMEPARCEAGRSWWLPTTTMRAYQQDNVTQSYASECVMKDVVGIRYAWRESPCPFKNCAVYGADNGLPMSPFTYHGEAFKRQWFSYNKYVVKIH